MQILYFTKFEVCDNMILIKGRFIFRKPLVKRSFERKNAFDGLCDLYIIIVNGKDQEGSCEMLVGLGKD